MKIKIIRSHDDIIQTEFQAACIKTILSGLKLHYGKEFTDSLLNDGYKYVLLNESDPESAVALMPEVVFSSYIGFDTLVIVRDIEGEVTAAVVAAAIGVSTTVATVIAVVVNLAISIALNVLMQALSPTPEFASDPSEAQRKQSNLFNGAPMIREQGGIVPWILGAPYCGGVLISAGVSSEDF